MSGTVASPSCWQRTRWTWLVAGVTLVVFLGSLLLPGVFQMLGVYPMEPNFVDLIAILAAGEAAHLGWNVYASNPLDPLGRPHVYGPWWLATGAIGLVRADAWWLGLVLAGIFLIVATTVLAPRNARAALVAVLLLASPPTLLALERGNNDLVVFLLLTASVWLVTRVNRVAAVVAGGLMVLAAGLKLYPLAAFPALAGRAGSRRQALGIVFGAASALLLAVLPAWKTFRMVAAIAPSPQTVFGHGAKLAYYILQQLPQQRVWVLVGGVSAACLLLGFVWRWRRVLWSMLPVTGFTSGCYVAGGLAWGFCYAATTNYPYRMLLLLLPARFWLAAKVDAKTAQVSRWQCALVVLFFWTPRLNDWLLRTSETSKYYTASSWGWMAIGVEQALALAVALSLAVVLAGWAWRRFQPPTGSTTA